MCLCERTEIWSASVSPLYIWMTQVDKRLLLPCLKDGCDMIWKNHQLENVPANFSFGPLLATIIIDSFIQHFNPTEKFEYTLVQDLKTRKKELVNIVLPASNNDQEKISRERKSGEPSYRNDSSYPGDRHFTELHIPAPTDSGKQVDKENHLIHLVCKALINMVSSLLHIHHSS